MSEHLHVLLLERLKDPLRGEFVRVDADLILEERTSDLVMLEGSLEQVTLELASRAEGLSAATFSFDAHLEYEEDGAYARLTVAGWRPMTDPELAAVTQARAGFSPSSTKEAQESRKSLDLTAIRAELEASRA
jgi:hypothetical protein